MTERGVSVVADILCHLAPETLVIANFLTLWTDRYDTA